MRPPSLRATSFRMETTMNESKLGDSMNNPPDIHKVEVGEEKLSTATPELTKPSFAAG